MTATTTLPRTATAAERLHRRRVAWTMFVIGMVLLIGWPIAIAVSWDDIVASHARLGYLIGDLAMVMPLCFLTWHGLLKEKRWSIPLLLVTIGAQAFDCLHFGIYLIQEEFLSIPLPVYLVIIAVVLGVLGWWAWWEGRRFTIVD